jgi:hypothetical protein
LCWANPPYNAFDDHFEPILMIMKSGVTPAKNVCFQCFQPPVFYWLSALIGDAALWGYMLNNARHYGSPLPGNLSICDPSIHRPRDADGISFVSFQPW